MTDDPNRWTPDDTRALLTALGVAVGLAAMVIAVFRTII